MNDSPERKPLYITIPPHSNTNPSIDYVVVESGEWQRYVNGAARTYHVYYRVASLVDAVRQRDALNDSVNATAAGPATLERIMQGLRATQDQED